jgi:eukaryotic-like serine/threonine-protein kinase
MALTHVGPYRILEHLGAGANGEVLLAEDTRLRRQVAIKTLLARGGHDDSELQRRLLREARAAARLNHPHIAAVYDILESDEAVHIVMEYVPGRTLSSQLRAGPLPSMEVLRLGLQLAAALSHAHSLGVIHRDLKPANIITTLDGQAKILDFGLARLHGSDLSSTDGSVERHPVVGTPPYIPPEHLCGQPVDVRGDIYSLGVTLFEMLTGRRPFEARDGVSLETAILSATTPRPRSFSPEVPLELDGIVHRAIARSPEERYGSAGDLETALRNASSSIVEADTRSGHRLVVRRPWVPRKVVSWVAAAAVVATAGLYARRWWPCCRCRAPPAIPRPRHWRPESPMR